jgi:hypothetical protein
MTPNDAPPRAGGVRLRAGEAAEGGHAAYGIDGARRTRAYYPDALRRQGRPRRHPLTARGPDRNCARRLPGRQPRREEAAHLFWQRTSAHRLPGSVQTGLAGKTDHTAA